MFGVPAPKTYQSLEDIGKVSVTDKEEYDELMESTKLLEQKMDQLQIKQTNRKQIVVTATIFETQIINGHVEYAVFATVRQPPEPGKSWTVNRRYRHFLNLDLQLHELFGQQVMRCLPPIPATKIVRSLDPDYVEAKRVALDRYLQALAMHPLISNSNAFSSFLVGTFEEIMNTFACKHEQFNRPPSLGIRMQQPQQRAASIPNKNEIPDKNTPELRKFASLT